MSKRVENNIRPIEVRSPSEEPDKTHPFDPTDEHYFPRGSWQSTGVLHLLETNLVVHFSTPGGIFTEIAGLDRSPEISGFRAEVPPYALGVTGLSPADLGRLSHRLALFVQLPGLDQPLWSQPWQAALASTGYHKPKLDFSLFQALPGAKSPIGVIATENLAFWFPGGIREGVPRFVLPTALEKFRGKLNQAERGCRVPLLPPRSKIQPGQAPLPYRSGIEVWFSLDN